MKRFSLRLSDKELEKISGYAEETEQSLNDVIRQAIREWKPQNLDSLSSPSYFVEQGDFPLESR